MRYLAWRTSPNGPEWWTVDGTWSRCRSLAQIFASGFHASAVINGGRSFADGDAYQLEVYGGLQ